MVILYLPTLVLRAQETTSTPETTTTVTIVDHFTSVGGNTVVQPDALMQRLLPILDATEIEEADERRDTPAASGSRPA
ncbi:MAG: hypothetical protein K2K72_00830, partial [Duncaniella sp.]|nr:hypothetical protein [Duncaniella sp.]